MATGLYSAKPWFVRRLRGLEDSFVELGVSANSLSLLAVIASAVAGLAIVGGAWFDHPGLWLIVAPLCIVRLALNALDGSVARRSRTDRPSGAAINEIADRASDALLIGPLAAVASPPIVVVALVTTFLVSTMGLVATFVTGSRDNGGPVAKADRVALVAAAALIAGLTGSTASFEWSAWALFAGGLITIAARARRMMRGGGR